MNFTLPGLRQLKAARLVAELGSISAAAEALNRTQSAVSKAVGNLETELAVRLFDRTAQGVETTPQGKAFIERVRQAENEFQRAAALHAEVMRQAPVQSRLPADDAAAKPARVPMGASHNPVFNMDISHQRLAAFLAVHETLDVPTAAARLGITRAAVYSSLRLLEHWLGCALFTSGRGGISATPFAAGLAEHTHLALALIRHGLEDLASFKGEIHGRVIIGTLPYSRTVLIPRTIDHVLRAHPGLHIATREGPYNVLERSLRSGELDFIIGATRSHDAHSAVQSENLFEDELAVICDAQHPLASAERIDFPDLLDYGWVLPGPQTPARQLFEQWVSDHTTVPLREVVETGSLSTLRGLLLESERLALLSRHQVYYEERAGLLKTLPIRLLGTSRPIGITRRSHSSPSPAAGVFIETLRLMAAQLPALGGGPAPRAGIR